MNFLSMWQSAKVSESGKLSRRAWAEIFYTRKSGGFFDITEDVSKYFLSLDYTDNLSDTADDINLTLEDIDRLWIGSYMPQMGDYLSAVIHTYAWSGLNDGEKVLDIGKFEIDNLSGEEIPTTVQIKAVSILSDNKTLREAKKSRSWDNINLKKIASDVASTNGLELFWDVDDDPEIDHVEQSDESDLELLQRLCKDAGHALKVTAEKIIIFDEYKYEMKSPSFTFAYPGDSAGGSIIDEIEKFTFDIKTRDVYSSCEVKYQEGKGKRVIEGSFTPPGDIFASNGKVLSVKESVKDEAEAVRLAKKRLRDKNKDAVKVSLTTPGNLNIAAGLTANLSGFGKLDGKYIITKAAHKLADSYTTSVDLRRCLNGY